MSRLNVKNAAQGRPHIYGYIIASVSLGVSFALNMLRVVDLLR